MPGITLIQYGIAAIVHGACLLVLGLVIIVAGYHREERWGIIAGAFIAACSNIVTALGATALYKHAKNKRRDEEDAMLLGDAIEP